jgi:hypothetical protein
MKKEFKTIVILLFTLCITINKTYSQNTKEVPKLLPLIHVDLHAGCYIGNDTRLYSELTADSVNFNLRGFDEVFKQLKNVKLFPKGYTEGYTNGTYNIYIKGVDGKKEGCLTEMMYKIMIIYKKKLYRYTYKGFCGC